MKNKKSNSGVQFIFTILIYYITPTYYPKPFTIFKFIYSFLK
jgi:hypothetical protein